MLIHKMNFGSSVFLLAPDTEVAELKDKCIAAAATTGTYVDFVTTAGEHISVLVTSHSSVHFAAVEEAVPALAIASDPSEEWSARFTNFDLDWFGNVA